PFAAVVSQETEPDVSSIALDHPPEVAKSRSEVGYGLEDLLLGPKAAVHRPGRGRHQLRQAEGTPGAACSRLEDALHPHQAEREIRIHSLGDRTFEYLIGELFGYIVPDRIDECLGFPAGGFALSLARRSEDPAEVGRWGGDPPLEEAASCRRGRLL